MQRLAVWPEAEFLSEAPLPSSRVFLINEAAATRSLHFSTVCDADSLRRGIHLWPLTGATYVFVPNNTPIGAWVNQNWVYEDAAQRADFLSLTPKTAPQREAPPMEKSVAVWAIAQYWKQVIDTAYGVSVDSLAEDLYHELMKESTVFFGGAPCCSRQTDSIMKKLGFFGGWKEIPSNATTWIDWRTGRPKVKVDGAESFLNLDGSIHKVEYLSDEWRAQ